MNKNYFYSSFFVLLTIVVVFFISINFLPYYIYGDQVHYHRVYNGLLGGGLSDSYSFYKANLDSKEPGYFLLAWVSVNIGINKLYFVTFFNVLLAYFGFKYLTKVGGHPFIVFLLVSFGFYSYVLFFSAERLKFSIVFLLLGLLYSKRNFVFYLMSILTHAQIIIVFSAAFLLRIKKDIFKLIVDFKVRKSFLFFLFFCFFMFVFLSFSMREHLVSKFSSYFEVRGLLELLKLSAFFVLSYFYAENKKDVIIFFIPLFFFTLIFGGERVNFLGYFSFLYFSLHYKKGFNLGVFLTTAYFLYAGFEFLLRVIKYGDGFYNV